MLPHLLVMGTGNSCDPSLAGLGRRLSMERSGGCECPIGKEIGYCNRHYSCLFYTARSNGIEFRDEEGVGRGAQSTGGHKEARIWRLMAEKRTGACRRRHMCFENADPTYIGGEQGGVVSQEKDHEVVTDEKLQGTAYSTWILFARRPYIAMWPRFTRTVRDTAVAGV